MQKCFRNIHLKSIYGSKFTQIYDKSTEDKKHRLKSPSSQGWNTEWANLFLSYMKLL